MAKKTFSENVLQTLYQNEALEGFEFIETTSWEDDGKYSSCGLIFKDLSDGKIYEAGISRSGSYFSYYEYDYNTECYEVEKKEVVITRWERVN